jgi:hypothetical protein
VVPLPAVPLLAAADELLSDEADEPPSEVCALVAVDPVALLVAPVTAAVEPTSAATTWVKPPSASTLAAAAVNLRCVSLRRAAAMAAFPSGGLLESGIASISLVKALSGRFSLSTPASGR